MPKSEHRARPVKKWAKDGPFSLNFWNLDHFQVQNWGFSEIRRAKTQNGPFFVIFGPFLAKNGKSKIWGS